MSGNEEIYKALGRLEEAVITIKTNTDKIPEIQTGLALVKQDVEDIKPKVKRHERVMWVGSGVVAVFTLAWSGLLAWFEGGRH